MRRDKNRFYYISTLNDFGDYFTIYPHERQKYNLYEMCGVKYYIIADPQKKSVEGFELRDNKYKETNTTTFVLTRDCSIIINVFNLWL